MDIRLFNLVHQPWAFRRIAILNFMLTNQMGILAFVIIFTQEL
jgi:hypothetical protein